MNHAEYGIMADLEDAHWWYRSLRGIIQLYSHRYMTQDSPRILDIGCGTGANMQLLMQHATVFGLDLSEEALRLSKTRDVPCLSQANAMSLPFNDGCFDLCTLMDVLYHRAVEDKCAPLKESWRVLKPGGYLFINVPAYAWLASSHDRAIHTDHRFTRAELHALLLESGFEPLRITYWNTLLFPAVALVRLLRKHSDQNESDLSGYTSSIVTYALECILGVERVLMRLTPMPFGVSIFAVGRKPL